jgi:hypothetical protein
METIKKIILNGVLKDVLLAERSYSLNQEINANYSTMPKGISVAISNILYDLSYTEMVLAICRIYDTPKRYQTACLKQIYKVIKAADYNLDIPHKDEVLLQSPFFELPENIIELLRKSDNKDFNKRAVAYFEYNEINEPLAKALDNVKIIRNKLLAHNEDVPVDTLIHYDDIKLLLKHAQNAISFFCLGYCGIHLKTSERFYLSSSARKWRYSFKQFLNQQNAS